MTTGHAEEGIYLAVAVGFLALLWLLVPMLSGLPWVPSRKRRIRRAFEMAGLRPGEVLFDLGAGDGRVLVAAARDFGAQAVGIELSPLHCLVARTRARFAGVGSQVRIRLGNFYRADLHQADVVFAFLTSREAARLVPHLETQLRPGARVVAASCELPGWIPDAWDRHELLFLYRMPPKPGNLGDRLALESDRG